MSGREMVFRRFGGAGTDVHGICPRLTDDNDCQDVKVVRGSGLPSGAAR